MASSDTTAAKCATCVANSDGQKVKPGIAVCEGCDQAYCLPHFIEHRQTLNNKLDDIAGQRDSLRLRIEELPTELPNEHLETIDNWEKTMLQTVTEVASNTRQQVNNLIMSEMERECNELTNKITSFRDNDNGFEADIEELQTTIDKLNEELNDLPSLPRIQLNLPTLDSSNIIHIKRIKTNILPETMTNESSVITKPRKEYISFIQQFLDTRQPSMDLSTTVYGSVCTSSTMLVDITHWKANRLIFNRRTQSSIDWKHGSPLDIKWSASLQQFIVLTNQSIVAVDAMEKESNIVVKDKKSTLQYIALWKHLALVYDTKKRLFLYEMNNQLKPWFFLYCWSTNYLIATNRTINAIGIDNDHIVLSVDLDGRYHFAIYNHSMSYCLDIQLTYACTDIQALPHGEWLLYNGSAQLYYVIDSNLEQHDEPYLSSLKDFQLTINCEERDTLLISLLGPGISGYIGTTRRIQVYTSNYWLRT